MVSITNASKTSTTIISRLRSTRSTHAPINRPKSKCGSAKVKVLMARLIGEWVSWKTSSGSAKPEKELPSTEIVCPVKNFQKSWRECTVECYLDAVKAPPEGFDETALTIAVADRWRVDVESISYEAVGGGSHHWLLRTANAGYGGFHDRAPPAPHRRREHPPCVAG